MAVKTVRELCGVLTCWLLYDSNMIVLSALTGKAISVVMMQDEGPTAVESLGSCAYNIRWETPVACPRNRTVSGVNGSCSLTDPSTGLVYDLHTLARANSYYVVNNTGRSFKVFDECARISWIL